MNRRDAGFTLLEMIISMGILLTVISMVSFGTFRIRENLSRAEALDEMNEMVDRICDTVKNAENIVYIRKNELKFHDFSGKETILEKEGFGIRNPCRHIVPEKLEFSAYGSDPALDMNADGIIDFQELDTDGDGFLNAQEAKYVSMVEFVIGLKTKKTGHKVALYTSVLR